MQFCFFYESIRSVGSANAIRPKIVCENSSLYFFSAIIIWNETRPAPKIMRIRELVPEDRNELLRILKATGVFKDFEIEIADEVLRDSLNPSSTYRTFCCVDENKGVIGYVCWGATPCTSGTFDLYWMAVDPAHQGNGIGKQLLEFAEQQVRRERARLMIIETSSTPEYDATRKFYQTMGYAELAFLPDFYRPGDGKVIYGKNFVS